MPLVELDPEETFGFRAEGDKIQPEPRTTLGGLARATIANVQDNTVVNAGINIAGHFSRTGEDPDYDVFSDLAGYEDLAHEFIGIENDRGAVAFKKEQIDRKREINKTFASSTFLENIAGGVGGGFVEPFNFVPVGGSLWNTYKTGGRILEGAARTAFVGAASQAGAEAVLQETQPGRTSQESFANIGAVTFLSGVMGGAASVFSPSQMNSVAKNLDRELTVPVQPRFSPFDTPLDGPRGVRNNNPGNIEYSVTNKWQGQAGVEDQGRFSVFETPQHGIRAMAKLLQKYQKDGAVTIEQMIGKYAPSAENNTAAYVEKVSRETGIAPDQQIDMTDTETASKVIKSMIDHENGGNPYPDHIIEEGVQYANMAAPSPLSKLDPGAITIGQRDLEADMSLSAASSAPTNAELKLKSALGVEKLLAKTSPLLRTLTSKSMKTRRAAQELAQSPFLYEGNALGLKSPVAVETRVEAWDTPLANTLVGLENNFSLYRRGKGGGRTAQAAIGMQDMLGKARRDGKLTYKEFREEVGKAMRRGDTHEIPEIAEAARQMRKELFDPLKDKAIAAKLLPEDVNVETAASYLSRVYNHEKIIAQRPEFKRIIREWLQENSEIAKESIEPQKQKIKAIREQITGTKREAQNIEDTTRKQAVQTLYGEINKSSEDIEPLLLNDVAISAKGITALEKMKAAEKSKFKQLLNEELSKTVDDIVRRTFIEHSDADMAFISKALAGDGGAITGDILEGVLERGLNTDVQFGNIIDIDLNAIKAKVAAEVQKKLSKRTFKDTPDTLLSTADIMRMLKADAKAEARKIAAQEAKKASQSLRKAVDDKMKELRKETEQLRKFMSDSNKDDYLDSISDEIIDHILGTPDGRLPYDMDINDIPGRKSGSRKGPSGAFKARSLLIPDERIEGFLQNDIDLIARIYKASVAPDVELATRFGDVDMTLQMKEIADDYNKLIGEATSEKMRTKLNKEKNAAIEDIAAMRDRLRGTYGLPANPSSWGRNWRRAARVSRQVNLLSKLGGRVSASFPDIGRPVMQEGLIRTFKNGLVPMVKNFRQFKVARKEAKELGAIAEMVLNTRLHSMGETMNIYGKNSKLERGLQGLNDSFGLVTLGTPWDQFIKEFSGAVSMNRILTETGNWKTGKIKKGEIEKLAATGIDQATAVRIADQFEKHGIIDDGVKIANYGAWDDPIAYRAMRDAMVRETRNAVVTPGIGHRPLWMSSEAGKMIGQFKSFSLASAQTVLISGLQRRDAATLNGAMLSVGVGMMVYALKSWEAGREVSDDPRKWVIEGIDRSGVTGWFFEVNNIMEKATRGRVGLSPLLGQEPMSRYASRNATGALLGPSFGQAQDIMQLTGSIASGEWEESDTHAVRRLLPYQNLFLMRKIFDQVEDNLNESLGVR